MSRLLLVVGGTGAILLFAALFQYFTQSHNLSQLNETSEYQAVISLDHSQAPVQGEAAVRQPASVPSRRPSRGIASVAMSKVGPQPVAISKEKSLENACHVDKNNFACHELMTIYFSAGDIERGLEYATSLCLQEDNFSGTCVSVARLSTDPVVLDRTQERLVKSCINDKWDFDQNRYSACVVLSEKYDFAPAREYLCRKGDSDQCLEIVGNMQELESFAFDNSIPEAEEQLEEAVRMRSRSLLYQIAYGVAELNAGPPREDMRRAHREEYFGAVGSSLEELQTLARGAFLNHQDVVLSHLDQASDILCNSENEELVRNYFCIQ